MTALGLVTARGGSKGLPRKNLRNFAGKPLIVWTVEAALGARSLDRVVVSTEDDEIAAITHKAGAEVPFRRPIELAADGTPHVSVVEHALEWADRQSERPDRLVILQPTSPLRTAGDIEAACRLADDRKAAAVVSVSKVKPHPFRARTLGASGELGPPLSFGPDAPRRQDLPQTVAPNGAIYVVDVEAFRRERSLFPEGTLAYVMPMERSVDIDTEEDFRLAERLFLSAPGRRAEIRPSGGHALTEHPSP